MTKEELLFQLKAITYNTDAEVRHLLADNLLLEYINDLDIKDAYNEMPKAYA